MYNKVSNKRTRNPNKERSILLFNIIILCVITLTAIAVAAFFYFRMQTAETMLREMNDRLSGSNGMDKTLYTAEELEAQREDARIAGEESGEHEIKMTIQSSLASGNTTLTMLRQLFPEDIVVSNQGKYYFYPISQEIPHNSFQKEDFALDDEGLLTYHGMDPDITLEQGIQVSAEDGVIDWMAVAKDHVDYAMIYVGGRDANGELTEDASFTRNIRGARNAGLSIGVYYSLTAATKEEAQEDAEWLVDILAPYEDQIDSYAAVLIRVSESKDRTSGLGRSGWTENIRIVTNTLKLAGYQPILFGNLTAMMMLTEPEAANDLARWISNIGTDLYFPYTFDMWRYASESRVDGIEEPVARSVRLVHNN